jgi:hypothetical protein
MQISRRVGCITTVDAFSSLHFPCAEGMTEEDTGTSRKRLTSRHVVAWRVLSDPRCEKSGG